MLLLPRSAWCRSRCIVYCRRVPDSSALRDGMRRPWRCCSFLSYVTLSTLPSLSLLVPNSQTAVHHTYSSSYDDARGSDSSLGQRLESCSILSENYRTAGKSYFSRRCRANDYLASNPVGRMLVGIRARSCRKGRATCKLSQLFASLFCYTRCCEMAAVRVICGLPQGPCRHVSVCAL